MAQLGWIDFSDDHRKRVFSVIDMLSEEGTIDELGIGTIRDSIADLLYPGLSTIQTRPKYFILLPQIFQTYLKEFRKNGRCSKLDAYLRDNENRFMYLLAEAYNYQVGKGVIGVNVAKHKGELARKASSIYWNGLKTHGIIQTSLSLSEYLQKNDLSNYWREQYQSEDGMNDDEETMWESNFGLTIPHSFQNSENELAMELSREEAEFLKDKFIDCNSGRKKEENLLRQILLSPTRMEIVSASENFQDMTEALLDDPTLPEASRTLLLVAYRFDFLTQGAHIRYNIQLQQIAGLQQDDARWKEWLSLSYERKEHVERLDLKEIFTTIAPRTPSFTQKFLHSWKSQILKNSKDEVALDLLVREQENTNKRGKAKLQETAAREINGWVGIKKLDYRFNTVKNIIADIKQALADA